jgi:hypothetical protein
MNNNDTIFTIAAFKIQLDKYTNSVLKRDFIGRNVDKGDPQLITAIQEMGACKEGLISFVEELDSCIGRGDDEYRF